MMHALIDRRLFIASAGAAAAVGLAAPASAVFTPTQFLMWHRPGCSCCLEWARQMGVALGRKLPIIEAPNLPAIKQARGVPADLHSCHTSLVAGYVIEGHVPPADIKRLMKSGSRTIRGLAVAGMPHGSPGMETPDGHTQPYKVIAFAANGRRSVYASYS
jgi:hypothetical protein